LSALRWKGKNDKGDKEMNNYCVEDCNDCPLQTEYLEPKCPQFAKGDIEVKCAMQEDME
jgi:hypothetical protein